MFFYRKASTFARLQNLFWRGYCSLLYSCSVDVASVCIFHIEGTSILQSNYIRMHDFACHGLLRRGIVCVVAMTDIVEMSGNESLTRPNHSVKTLSKILAL